jgi:transcription elongation factor Elf1
MPVAMAERIKIDPRDFIGEPYRTCPKCGHETFGILSISRSEYTRCCRECWNKADFHVPEVRKKIIYLDQFVISNLVKLKNPKTPAQTKLAADPFWQELYDLIFQLRYLQMICCPDSWSHEEESRISNMNADLKKMYEQLSGGNSFHQFNDIKSEQIGELALAWSEGREPQFDFDPRSVLYKDPDEWNERYFITFQDNPFVTKTGIRQTRQANHANVARLFTNVWAKEVRNFDYWYDLERTDYQRSIIQSYVLSQHERQKAIASINPSEQMSLEVLNIFLPSFAEGVIASIQHVVQFPHEGGIRTPEEQAKLLFGFFKANRISDAPFLKLQAMMYAVIAMRAAGGQREPPNEGMTTDIDTLAHLLPYCDAMFMDKECRALMLNVPMRVRPEDANKLYSMQVKNEFLAFLREIRNSITVEHVQAIREVYGDKDLHGVPAAQM